MPKLKHVVLLVLALLLYGGWKAAPLLLMRSRIDRELDYALKHVGQDAQEHNIGLRVEGKTFLEPEHFSVEKEDLYGRRIIRVDVRVPQVVSVFGVERTHEVRVLYTHEIEVNEEALARSMERHRVKQARASRADANSVRRKQNLEAAYEDCERRYGRGQCRVLETDQGESIVQPRI